MKTTPKKVIFLTWEELNRLKDYQIPKDKQYLERVRDVFLFCCFTSLRYSEMCIRDSLADSMKAQGLLLEADDIYNPNRVSLKDAVGIFGGGCTGEIISPHLI